MRGNDDCCNLVGRRVGKQTVRKRRNHGIQIQQTTAVKRIGGE